VVAGASNGSGARANSKPDLHDSVITDLHFSMDTRTARRARRADPPITEPEGDSLAWAFPRLQVLVGDLGCSLVIERQADGRGGCFIPDQNLISLNETNSTNHQIKTLVHELSHALLRHTDLGDIALSYSEEELVVESIALTVVGGLGLDTSGSSIPYIASWSQDDDSLDIIETCAAVIDRLSKRIEDTIGDPPALD
jgi:hypothetical protein